MKKILLIASAAAMTVTMPAVAQPEKGNKGGGNKGAQAATAQKGQDGARGRGQQFKAERQSRGQGGPTERDFRPERQQVKTQQRTVERGQRARAEDRGEWHRERERDDRRVERIRYENDRPENRLRLVDDDRDDRGFCPPGLARKNNGCLPPGQAKKIFAVGEQLRSDWYRDYNLPAGYRDFYSDTSDYYYRYDDNGYIYRVNRDSNLVSSLIPLLGGGFGVGQMLPAGYSAYNVPLQYRDVYYDTDDAYYRYGDNAIYQVDPQSGLIESVVALLAGDTLGIGQTLPAGYGAYNLPLQYRDQYFDNDQYMYRYADGNIYQADAKTQIIQAVISALI